MRITAKQILHLPVVSEGGKQLGKVKDVIFQTDSFSISHFEVARAFSRSCFLVAVSQVVVIRQDVIVVKDGVVRENEKKIPVTISPIYTQQ